MGEQAPPPVPSRLSTFAPPKPSRLTIKEKTVQNVSPEANTSSAESSNEKNNKAEVKVDESKKVIKLTKPESTFRREPVRPVEVAPPQVPARLTSLGLKKSTPPPPPPSRYKFDEINHNCNQRSYF